MTRGAEKGMDRSGVEELGARLIQPEDVGEVVWDVVTKPERYHVKLRADRKTISPKPQFISTNHSY